MERNYFESNLCLMDYDRPFNRKLESFYRKYIDNEIGGLKVREIKLDDAMKLIAEMDSMIHCLANGMLPNVQIANKMACESDRCHQWVWAFDDRFKDGIF